MQDQKQQISFNSKNIYSQQEFPLIPPEAFRYFPTKQEQIEGEGASALRRIFEGQVEYSIFEKEQLQQLELAIRGQALKLTEWWSKCKKLRFLYANKFNIDKTIETIDKHQQWRNEILPLKITDTAMELIQTGAIYLHGHDNRFRPIIIIDISKLKKNVKLETICEGMTYFFEFILENVFLPGQIENWIVILDLKKCGATQLPINNIKGLMSFLQSNYRSRMYKCYIVNSTWTITGVWKMVKQFLMQNTINKIKFESNEPKGLFEHCHPSQVEQQYGGTAPNKNNNYWPAERPSKLFWIPSDEPEKILVSSEQYINQYRNNKLDGNKIALEQLVEPDNYQLKLKYIQEPILNENGRSLDKQTNQNHAFNFRKGNLQIEDIVQEKEISQKLMIVNAKEYLE
ncbi:CRAL-TRIO domain [Pseudocohnilembus persalinus]|uniref:CRAL-TRIO domain n=1 Tax=Pseudocohnilembus persalinus TaxID=266149 RepID=A0A0V0RAC6_PSEPJ|nr:CRAL-TRIO domain [Pseudocohnilembus persalinus]|eukprot:KRX11221.1 CRAL-TRIO domain [Pseudocohnilembus persalinus]